MFVQYTKCRSNWYYHFFGVCSRYEWSGNQCHYWLCKVVSWHTCPSLWANSFFFESLGFVGMSMYHSKLDRYLWWLCLYWCWRWLVCVCVSVCVCVCLCVYVLYSMCLCITSLYYIMWRHTKSATSLVHVALYFFFDVTPKLHQNIHHHHHHYPW